MKSRIDTYGIGPSRSRRRRRRRRIDRQDGRRVKPTPSRGVTGLQRPGRTVAEVHLVGEAIVAGTRIEGCEVVRVVDGDSLRVRLPADAVPLARDAGLDAELAIRVPCLDTEESRRGSSKPVTVAGTLASGRAQALLPAGAAVTLEFDTADPPAECFRRHQDNYQRLLAYVLLGDGADLTRTMISEGFSPYFVKYGRSRLRHGELLAAEAQAQADRKVIWDPDVNAGGPSRDYGALLPWWGLRDSIVQDFRTARPAGVLSVRLDHGALVRAAREGAEATVFADLQQGIDRPIPIGHRVLAGSPNHPLDLIVRDDVPRAAAVLDLIERRYAGTGGRGYVFVSGRLSVFRGRPQIELADPAQLRDTP
jgi:micrococcal nuclease